MNSLDEQSRAQPDIAMNVQEYIDYLDRQRKGFDVRYRRISEATQLLSSHLTDTELMILASNVLREASEISEAMDSIIGFLEVGHYAFDDKLFAYLYGGYENLYKVVEEFRSKHPNTVTKPKSLKEVCDDATSRHST